MILGVLQLVLIISLYIVWCVKKRSHGSREPVASKESLGDNEVKSMEIADLPSSMLISVWCGYIEVSVCSLFVLHANTSIFQSHTKTL